MKPSFFGIVLTFCAGGYIALMGVSGYGATPLLVLAGIFMLGYSTVKMFSGHGITESGTTKRLAAYPCREMNHAGCQDNPDCACGCHRERIEISVGSQ